jgi:hypothetical protein
MDREMDYDQDSWQKSHEASFFNWVFKILSLRIFLCGCYCCCITGIQVGNAAWELYCLEHGIQVQKNLQFNSRSSTNSLWYSLLLLVMFENCLRFFFFLTAKFLVLKWEVVLCRDQKLMIVMIHELGSICSSDRRRKRIQWVRRRRLWSWWASFLLHEKSWVAHAARRADARW